LYHDRRTGFSFGVQSSYVQAPPPLAEHQSSPLRRSIGATALERVKIPRLGRSLSAAVLFALVGPAAARAQDVRPDAATHIVKKGDTLWDLAKSYLGDAYLWPEIYRLNTDQIDDPHWIYPGEVLRLPTRAVAQAPAAAPSAAPAAPVSGPVVDQPSRVPPGPTSFAPRRMVRPTNRFSDAAPPARVPFGDILRAPYFERDGGPRGYGKLLFAADIPGIEKPRQTDAYSLFDKVYMDPPAGAVAAEGDKFVAYTLGRDIEDVGTVVIPNALLRVVRAPRAGEAATVEVLELYNQLNEDNRIIPLDTAGALASAAPIRLAAGVGKVAKIREINRASVLPSLDYYVLFDLSSRDGMRIGDEIEIYRPRDLMKGEDSPAIPEIPIATAQVVRVTRYGATARVTGQSQPAIQEGENVRVVARMP
jgi:LysM repeat protein